MSKLAKTAVPICLLLGASLAYASGSFDLEPCMNGEVSASGAFRSDAAELQFYTAAEQEPCINGAVPSDGVLGTRIETRPVILVVEIGCSIAHGDWPMSGICSGSSAVTAYSSPAKN